MIGEKPRFEPEKAGAELYKKKRSEYQTAEAMMDALGRNLLEAALTRYGIPEPYKKSHRLRFYRGLNGAAREQGDDTGVHYFSGIIGELEPQQGRTPQKPAAQTPANGVKGLAGQGRSYSQVREEAERRSRGAAAPGASPASSGSVPEIDVKIGKLVGNLYSIVETLHDDNLDDYLSVVGRNGLLEAMSGQGIDEKYYPDVVRELRRRSNPSRR